MLFSIWLISAAAAIPQLAPSDPSFCDDVAKREAFYKAEAALAQGAGDIPPGSTEAKARAKVASDHFFQRLHELAAKAKWSSHQRDELGGRIFTDPDIREMRSEPTKLTIKMLALGAATKTDPEPQKCLDLVEFLKIEDDLNSSDEKTIAAMNKMLDAEAQKLGISLSK